MDMFPEDDKYTAWDQPFIRKESNVASGSWKLFNQRAGIYQITIQQYPVENEKDFRPAFATPGSAFLKINNSETIVKQNISIKQATFTIKLPDGDIDLGAGFSDKAGKTVAAQFAYLKKVR